MNPAHQRLAAAATLALVALTTERCAPHVSQTSSLRTVRIATQSPLSERYEAQGEALMLAAKLAVEQLGGALRKRGLAVELVSFDDRASATVGIEQAQRIVADPNVLAVVGPLNSDVALRVADVYRDAGLAMISPSSTHPALTDRGFPNVFRVCGRDDVQSDVAARFIEKSLGAKTVYVVHDGTEYGRGNAEWFRAAAPRRHLTIVGFDAAQAESDVRTVAVAIKAKAPDAVYFGGVADVAGPLFKEARRAGVSAKLVGSDGLDSSELVRRAGDAAKGAYYTSVAGSVAVHPQARGFASDYREKFGKDPEPFAAQAYDATALVLQAIASASEHGVPPSRDAVTAAIRNMHYVGVTGHIRFDEHGDLRRALYLVMKVTVSHPEDWDDNRELKRLGIAPPSR